jgi:hypothetical protein
MRSTLDFVIGSIFGSNPRLEQERLPTNPILAATVRRRTDRRISAGFIVEAAAGTVTLRVNPLTRMPM